MFGPPGHAYVYLAYGIHHCVNVVTEPEGEGAAVLVRGLAPGVPGALEVEPPQGGSAPMHGPGLLCRALGISLALNGADLVDGDLLRICPGVAVPPGRVLVGPRVGISQARDLALRFRVGP